MNAKQLADKYGMLSPDEIDLLQHCVSLLSWGGFEATDKWITYDKQYKVSEVVEKHTPLTPKDLGFFLQGILSNIVNFQDEDRVEPRPASYFAGQQILLRHNKEDV